MSDFIEQLIASTIDPAAAFRPRPMSLFEASVSAALSVTGSEEPASVSVSFPAPHSVAAVPHMETPEIVPEHEHPPLTAPMSTEPVVREAVNPRVPDLPAPPPSALTTSPHPTVPADYFAEPAALPAIQPLPRIVPEQRMEMETSPKQQPVHNQSEIRSISNVISVRERSEAPSPSLSSMVRQMVLQPVVRTDIYKPTIERPTALGVADPAPLAPALPPESIPETPRPAAPLRPLPDASRRNALPVPILKPIATDVPVFPVVPPTPTPTIHVTIGRIEVRATTNAAPAAQKPRAEPAMMSLDDYLTQRAGGAGR